MIKVNRKTEYALMALKAMIDQSPGTLITVREICDRFQIPFDTTSKVLQQLNQRGIVEGVKGAKGGYIISSDLSKINYKEFTEIIEGKNFGIECVHGNCDIMNTCNISAPLRNLNQAADQFFAQLNLLDLLIEKHLTPLIDINQLEQTTRTKQLE
jgi:Rrf2 family protein